MNIIYEKQPHERTEIENFKFFSDELLAVVLVD